MASSSPPGRGADRPVARWRARAAVVAMAAAAVGCWLIAPVMDLTFSGGSRNALRWVPDAWLTGYDRVYEALGRPLGLSAYHFWGRFTVVFFAAGLFGALAFPRGGGRGTRVGRRMLVVGFGLALLGDVGAYWGADGRSPSGWQPPMTEQAAPDLQNANAFVAVGFLMESLAALLVLVALAVLGVALLRERRRPAWPAWAMLAGALGAVPFAALVIGYVPHGYLLPMLVTTSVALVGLTRRP